ncbi:hypothetical protein GGS20DRAFT_35995 [Poronia punctata]|nr:hypothetical protein GGS20DRAFT_35995 [Poronia punctata]
MPHPYEPPPPLPAEAGVHVWRAAIVVPIVAFFFVCARFYTRIWILKRRLAIDGYIVGFTMVVSIVHAVLMGIAAAYHGMGLHIWQYTPELNSEYYLWIGITSQFYVVGLAGFKSALVLLYLQTFGLVSTRFKIACYLTLFYTLGYLTCNLFAEFLGCWPIAKKWQADLPGHCIDRTAANTFFGIGHVTSDLIIALLPLPSIWNLTFPTTKQKIGLSLTLSSGFLAWTVATIRYVISTYDQHTYDRTWWAGIAFTFSILEVNTGLICACVPTFSPLLSRVSSSRATNAVTSWTTQHTRINNRRRRQSPDKASWHNLDLEYHEHLTGRPQRRSRAFSVGRRETVVPAASATIAAFHHPVWGYEDMSSDDLFALQGLAVKRDKNII